MKHPKTIAVLLGLTFAAGAALAHDDAYLDTQQAPNGGQLRMAGPYHYELVVVKDSREPKENPVLVYVTDHAGNKVSSAGAKGTATLLSGKLKVSATLKPDGDNRLKGFAKYPSTADMKVVVSLAFPGKPAEQARFTPMVASVKQAHDGH
jgi:hypothetical protein